MTRKQRLLLSTRELIIEKYIQGLNAKFISEFLLIPISTVCNIIKVYNEQFRVHSLPSGGARNIKVTDEIRMRIRNIVDENAAITLKRIGDIILAEFGVNVSTSTIDRTLASFHYSLKKLVPVPERRNSAENIEARFNYALRFLALTEDFAASEIFFADEVGFSVSMRRKKGRSLIGTPASLILPAIRSKNISVCAVVGRLGMQYKSINFRPYNTASFLGFIRDFFDVILESGLERCVVIIDNVAFHKAASIQNEFRNRNKELIFLPPYSPQLNPMEQVFSKWKSLVISGNAQNEENLLNLINNEFEAITPTDCEGYFRDMMRNINKCLRREEFLD